MLFPGRRLDLSQAGMSKKVDRTEIHAGSCINSDTSVNDMAARSRLRMAVLDKHVSRLVRVGEPIESESNVSHSNWEAWATNGAVVRGTEATRQRDSLEVSWGSAGQTGSREPRGSAVPTPPAWGRYRTSRRHVTQCSEKLTLSELFW